MTNQYNRNLTTPWFRIYLDWEGKIVAMLRLTYLATAFNIDKPGVHGDTQTSSCEMVSTRISIPNRQEQYVQVLADFILKSSISTV